MSSSGGGGGGGNTCDFTKIIPEPSEKKYRFFNQPIEQIPLWAADKFQILVHPPDGGLHWLTLETCQQVVTCLTLDGENVLKPLLKDVVVLKTFEVEDAQADACDVDFSACCDSSSSSSSSGEPSGSS
jgi:hypothetical protein